MCGLTGYWSKKRADPSLVEQMGLMLKHRGPDDSGVFINTDKTLAIAHRRLSIIDVSTAGHQPMVSNCGRFALAYNGEIYNHLDIREELKNSGFRLPWSGHSDTETLLASLCHWGVQDTLKRLNGMFAFSLWDDAEKTLTLARDRMGEKPMYYGSVGNTFFFGSELSSFKPHPSWAGAINRDVVSLYLRHNYVPDPWSIYSGIQKLAPAHYVVISNDGKNVSEQIPYWSLLKIIESRSQIDEKRPDDFIEAFNELLKDAIRKRLVSDVPLGALLSGGIDSSLVVSLMQEVSPEPVKTFTIGFYEEGYNEAEYAKKIAEHLGTEHTEMYVSSEEARDTIVRLPQIWDEPFADSSQIPTLIVSELTRQNVSVGLSGDGGDELFCGYSRYHQTQKAWQKLQHFPYPIRKFLSAIIKLLPGAPIERVMNLLPKNIQVAHISDRLPKFSDLMKEETFGNFYRHQVSLYNDPQSIVINGSEPRTDISLIDELPESMNYLDRMMYTDSVTYLPGDILTKVDRASMAVSLEARVPFLDHRVVELAWSAPLNLKYKNGDGKWLLKQLLNQHVPLEMFERPKKGFSVPIEEWLRGPLRDWSEELLSTSRLKRDDFFQPEPIQRMLKEHISGKRRWHHQLWNILMFQSWLEAKT
jgi:asparagine synthase (glutamine-hydrolysing)